MNENSKRVLREKKHHNYLATEIVDGQAYGYFRPGYVKDNVTPAADLNFNAKQLVKFINQANKKIKEHEMKDEAEELQPKGLQSSNMEHTMGKIIREQGVPKKEKISKKGNREDHAKKDKQLYRFGLTNEQKDGKKTQIQSEVGKRQGYGDRTGSSMTPYHNLPIFHNKESLKLPQNFASFKNDLEFSKRLEASQRAQIHSLRRKDGQKEKHAENGEKERGQRSKLFGRSAYHIAIAYNIHLEKLKKREKEDKQITLEILDPTYYSKQLKQNQEEQK